MFDFVSSGTQQISEIQSGRVFLIFIRLKRMILSNHEGHIIF